ncbi:hypothetical protein HanIR_Chr16g0836391 [Helianthus annuus]|nr:hypothetical protein HanIR_Chr16g0836391 [Helianthus annuus]
MLAGGEEGESNRTVKERDARWRSEERDRMRRLVDGFPAGDDCIVSLIYGIFSVLLHCVCLGQRGRWLYSVV